MVIRERKMTSSEQLVNILAVDDTPENLIALTGVLDDDDYRLVFAESGKEALRILLNENIALILLDVQMPDINGFEVAKLIKDREKTRGIPIIFISAVYLEQKDIFKGYRMGAFDYITKPFPNELLKTKVRTFADLYKRNQVLERNYHQLLRIELPQEKTDQSKKPDIDHKKDAVVQYKELLTKYLLHVKFDDEKPIDLLKAIVFDLAESSWTASDIVTLHLEALEEITKSYLPTQVIETSIDARLALIEILGRVSDNYLTNQYGNQSN